MEEIETENSVSVPTQRLYRTFVEGYDKALSGGIPHGHIVLISGAPGTMKSTLAFSILYHNAMESLVNGLYITLEQPRESLLRQMSKLGMTVGKEFGIEILDLSVFREGKEPWLTDLLPDDGAETQWFEKLKMILETHKRSLDFGLLAIDSLPVLEMICGVKNNRYGMFRLFQWLRSLNATVFLISEVAPDASKVEDTDFMADGLIHLTLERVSEIQIVRKIRTAKMREVDHETGYYTFEFNDGRFRALPKMYGNLRSGPGSI